MAPKIATTLANYRNVLSLKSALHIPTFFGDVLRWKSALHIPTFFGDVLRWKSALPIPTFFWNVLSLKSALPIPTFFWNVLSLKSALAIPTLFWWTVLSLKSVLAIGTFFWNVLSSISRAALATQLAIYTFFWNVLCLPFTLFRNVLSLISRAALATRLAIYTFFWNVLGFPFTLFWNVLSLTFTLAIRFANAVIGTFNKPPAETKTTVKPPNGHENESSSCSALPFYEKEGPWGGSGGSDWTDGTYSSIDSITVRHGDIIDAIQVNYRLNGTDNITAQQHGGDGGKEAKINFKRDENLTQIEGYFGEGKQIKSLTFKTNQGDYGPYGSQQKDGFFFRSTGKGKIVGFHGKAGGSLDGLGVYSI